MREHWRNPLDTEVRRKREYWAYNATGALALWTRHGQGEEVVALSYSYDSEGRVARRQGHRDWQPDSVTRYRYDPSGRLQQLDSDIDSDGAVDDVTRFDYSDSGRLVHERYYEGASATVPSVVVTYTWESDRVVALDVGQWGQKPEGGERLTYDAQRRLERRDMIAPGSPVTDWIEYEYGKDGLLSQVRSYRLGEWHDSWDYQYNHWGLLTQEEFHSTFEPSYVTRYQYELCTLPPRNPDPADCLIPLWCQLFPQPSYAISE